MADQTTQAAATTAVSADAPASKGTKVLRYIGFRLEYEGLRGSHREITKAQLVEAGVANPFTDASQDRVEWTPGNGYQVAKSVFTDAGYQRLLKEDDFEEATAE